MKKQKEEMGVIGVRLEKKTINMLQQEARRQAFEKKQRITLSTLIKKAIEKEYLK